MNLAKQDKYIKCYKMFYSVKTTLIIENIVWNPSYYLPINVF